MASPDPSIFTLIIQGEIPCHKVYEDEHVFSFLDINPCSVGHTLVVPKEQCASLDELSDEASAAVGRVLPRLSRAVLACLLYTSPSPRDQRGSRMPSSA